MAMLPMTGGYLMQAAVTANWWEVSGATCLVAYQAIGAASLAASYVNLANPGTYDAAPGVAPSWASGTGWTFNGTTQYLTTGLQLSDPCTMIVHMTRTAGHFLPAVVQGTFNTSPAELGLWTTNSTFGSNYGTLGWQVVVPTFPATYAVTRSALYKDGAQIATPGATFTPTANVEIARGTLSTVRYGAPIITAFAAYSAVLTAGQVATLSTAMAALT